MTVAFELDLRFVKENVPILELVREFQDELGMERGKVRPEDDRDQKTRCPIHNEETPSAKAYVRSNSIYCFVCDRTWDSPGLWAAYHGVSVGRAVRALLARLGRAQAYTNGGSVASELAGLAAVTQGVVQPQPEALTTQVALWLEELRCWARDRYLDSFGELYALEEVQELAGCLEREVADDPDEVMRVLRRRIAYARRIHPGLPAPPSEEPVALRLRGLPNAQVT